ncbi:MAG TPA: hypothetical protein DD734_02875, partial [Firmicutes bacterium]|nr:hypothetical protein [Bacillota bacterium]
FFFNDTATTEIYTLSLHDALPIDLRRSSLLDRIILKTTAEKEEGYSAVPLYAKEISQIGVVVHPLRPSGVIELDDGRRLDVVSEGAYIPTGRKVRVITVEGRRILVRVEG